MADNVPLFTIFLSSPGDVNDERQAALEVLARLPSRPTFRGKLAILPVAWDKPGAGTAMLASVSPQDAINAGLRKPSACDIVIVILWSRMGRPTTVDGKDYLSGTHYELMDALSNPNNRTVIYHRTEKKFFEYEDKEGMDQYQRVQDFFKSDFFYDPATKQGRRSQERYATIAEFREKLEDNLEEIVGKLLDRYTVGAPTAAPPVTIVDPAQFPPQAKTFEQWPGSPFPGLRAFIPADAPIFFGREHETDELVRRVADSRFVAVVGASGSGKSSLVGAGLLPRLAANAISSPHTLASKDWRIARFTPGADDHPFAALFEALLKAIPAICPFPSEVRRLKRNFVADMQSDPLTLTDTITHALRAENAPEWAEVLLFIDQFEELFTLVPKDALAPFVRMLETAVAHPRLRVVATIRHDFVHRPIEVPALAALLNAGMYTLAAPTTQALARMIARPADMAALEFEDGLIVQMLSDTGSDAGSLALLAYALDELYSTAAARGDRRLTFADYDAIGRVAGAIGRRAENTFAGLVAAGKSTEAMLGAVFHKLVEVDERGTATRHRALISSFSAVEMTLVRALTDARLLVMDTTHVEVAHESLFRSWDRLKNWIAEAQEDLILLRQLRAAADEWQHKGERSFLRWWHERLVLVGAMRQRLNPALSDIEKAFIEPEQDRLLREIADGLPQCANERERHKRRRWIGDRLDEIGDTRRGVGVGDDGLPDILWCAVPPPPNGTVMLGEDDQSYNERKEYKFSAPFLIAAYPVTFDQFEAFARADDGYHNREWWQDFPEEYQPQRLDNPTNGLGNSPRDTVSWYHAVAFTRWLNRQWMGRTFTDEKGDVALTIGRGAELRLPTEWEWEYAARGTDERPYPWGEWREGYANTEEAGVNRTIAVGMYGNGAAWCGVADMSGNVWEWCANKYSNSESRVLRGGSFNFSRLFAACASRNDYFPYYDSYFVGFRVVVAGPSAPSDL